MEEPNDPISIAILDLEAESKAMQVMIGFLLSSSSSAFANVESLEPVLGDLALQFRLTDRQVEVVKSTIGRTIEHVRRHRDTLASG